MFRLTLLCLGRLKEPFYQAAVAEYQKRLSGYCKLEIRELPEVRLPESPGRAEIAAALQKEAAAVRASLPKGALLVVCSPEGRQLSSEELAAWLGAKKAAGAGHVALLIGSSFGLDPSLKAEAALLLSFSKMTFPHHLFRILALEQLYRAESILAGGKYHK